MSQLDRLAPAQPEREIITARVIDAPRERVFQAWTDPGQLARWWGPNGFTNTIDEFDLRPGGLFSTISRARIFR